MHATRFPIVTASLFILFWILWPFYPFLYGGVGCNQCTADGAWWQLVTSIGIHYSFSHVLGNTLCFLLLGYFLERKLHALPFFLLFILAGISGNILTFFVLPLQFVHTGASGAIFGLIGAQLYFFYIERHRYTREQTFLIVALVFLIATTFFNPTANIISHLGGLLAGGILAPLFTLYKNLRHQ